MKPKTVKVMMGVVFGSFAVIGLCALFGGLGPLSQSSTGTTPSPEQQAAIAQGVCGVTLKLVRDYGVLPPSAILASTAAKQTGRAGFESCQANSDGDHYVMVAQVTCDDLTNSDCVELDSVKASDGTPLYRRQPYSEQPMQRQ